MLRNRLYLLLLTSYSAFSQTTVFTSGYESCEPTFIYNGVQIPYNSTVTPKTGTNHGQIDGACSGASAGCYDGSIITGSQFTFQPSCTYKVSVWAKVAVATGNLAIAKSITGTNAAMKSASGPDIIMAAATVSSTPAYVQYTASFTVSATETKYIGFQMYRAGTGGTAGSKMYLDEISITKECGQCTNGIQDGDETGIDCGGTLCANAAPVGGTVSPASQSYACGSGNFSLSLCGQTGNVQWQSSRDGSTWYDLSGQTGTAFAGTVRNTAYFRVKVTNDGCTPTPAYSNVATVTITGAGNKTWLTSFTNDWGTGTNWSPSGFPGACDNVTIPAGGIQPVITANAACNNLTINVGATLTNSVPATQYLNIYGDFKNDGTYNDASAATKTYLYGGNPSFLGGTGTFTNGNLLVAANANYILTSNIQVLNFDIQNNGSFSLASNKLIVTTNWNQLGNFFANTGILELQQSGVISPATSNWGEGTLYLNITPPSLKTFSSFDDYYNLIFEDAGNTITIDVSPLNVLNDLTIKPVTTLNFGASGNTINIGGSNPGGDWINDGTFIAGPSTVVFKGGYEQEIKGTGTTTFNNLTINNTSSTGVIVQTACTVNTALTLTDGILNTDNFVTYIYLPSTASVSPVGGSAVSYIDGYVQKDGTTAFVFPTGDGSKWRRIAIGAPSASSTFRAKYFNSGFLDYTVTPPLTDVSQIEYWILDRMIGTGSATVILNFEDASASGIDDCPDLTVAGWNGTSWTEQPATASGTCSGAGTGSVLTNAAVSAFGPITFGSKSLLVNPLGAILCSTPPTTQAANITFSAIACTQMTASWTNGDGSNRIVVARAGSAITGTPADGTDYAENSSFGSGGTIAAGEYVVYDNTGTSVTVTNLSPGTTYYFRVYEYNCTGTDIKYFTATATNNPLSQATYSLPVTSPITGSSSACEGDVGVVYSVTNTPGSSYSWTIPLGSTITSGAVTNAITVTFGSFPGDFKVTETDANGCVGATVKF